MDLIEVFFVVFVVAFLVRDAVKSDKAQRRRNDLLSEQTKKHFNDDKDE